MANQSTPENDSHVNQDSSGLSNDDFDSEFDFLCYSPETFRNNRFTPSYDPEPSFWSLTTGSPDRASFSSDLKIEPITFSSPLERVMFPSTGQVQPGLVDYQFTNLQTPQSPLQQRGNGLIECQGLIPIPSLEKCHPKEVNGKNPEIEDLFKKRRTFPKRSKQFQSSRPYLSPSLLDEIRRIKPIVPRDKAAGFNRQTGQLTLVGKYPAVMEGKLFICPDPRCRTNPDDKPSWTTKNGYKYHLFNCCLRNPDSIRSRRVAAGEDPIMKKSKSTFEGRCKDCNGVFSSETGFKKHLYENPSTMNGRCWLKKR
jgi:hypothetical protein